jgi:hypothetical protein
MVASGSAPCSAVPETRSTLHGTRLLGPHHCPSRLQVDPSRPQAGCAGRPRRTASPRPRTNILDSISCFLHPVLVATITTTATTVDAMHHGFCPPSPPARQISAQEPLRSASACSYCRVAGTACAREPICPSPAPQDHLAWTRPSPP